MKSVILLLLFSVIPAVAKLIEWDTPAKATGKLLLINNVLCIDTGERELHGTNLGETIRNNRGGIVAIDFQSLDEQKKQLKKVGQTITLSGYYHPVKSTLVPSRWPTRIVFVQQ